MEKGTEHERTTFEKWLIFFCYAFVIILFPLTIFYFKIVNEFQRIIVFRIGRLRGGGPKGPGIFLILPFIDEPYFIDLRIVSFDVPRQEVLTKDSCSVLVDAVVYYVVIDPMKAVINISNFRASTELLAATILRNIIGMRNLSEILSEREQIANAMQTHLDEATDPWGVQVKRVEVKDVRLPEQMQRAMAAEAEASREAKAKVIAAEGEMKAARSLKEASDILMESSGAVQLRYLQTLASISAEKNSTIVFPLPMEFLTTFGSKPGK